MFLSSLLFFAVNIWILGIIVRDVGAQAAGGEGIGLAKRGRGRKSEGSKGDLM